MGKELKHKTVCVKCPHCGFMSDVAPFDCENKAQLDYCESCSKEIWINKEYIVVNKK